MTTMSYYDTMTLQIASVEIEAAVEIEFAYSPGSPAYTPRGEYAPIDPPEPAEVDIRKVLLTFGDGEGIPAGTPAPDWMVKRLRDSDDLYRELCRYAEDHSGPDPDKAYEAWRDERQWDDAY